MDYFNWSPDPGASVESEAGLHTARFGDGYSQRTPTGINNVADTWSLTFTREIQELDAISNFLRAHATGEAFQFKSPRGYVKVVCTKWGVNYTTLWVGRVTCTFEVVYE